MRRRLCGRVGQLVLAARFVGSEAGSSDVSAGTDESRAPKSDQSSSHVAPRSDPQPPAKTIKVKKKAPWGEQQLRDSWTEDAMARHEKESIGSRIDFEHRFDPANKTRKSWSKRLALFPIGGLTIGVAAFKWFSGRWAWEMDYQHILNILRSYDCSPRSRYHPQNSAWRITDREVASSPFARFMAEDSQPMPIGPDLPKEYRKQAREERASYGE